MMTRGRWSPAIPLLAVALAACGVSRGAGGRPDSGSQGVGVSTSDAGDTAAAGSDAGFADVAPLTCRTVPATGRQAVVAGSGGTLDVTIFDSAHKPAAARVNVIGADHSYYQPAESDNSLYAYSLKRWGLRDNYGPARYYGSFFYAEGKFEVKLPPGPARIEVKKGYAYYPAIIETTISSQGTTTVEIDLQRMVDMPGAGWFSTDTHIHFDRPRVESDNLVSLIAAEDIRFGHSLSMFTNIKDYGMRQPGFGPSTTYTRGEYALESGNEHLSFIGHLTELNMAELPRDSSDVSNPDFWHGPSMAKIYDETRALSGALGHAHGGGDETYSDVVLGKSDWVELLQFGGYRGIGLAGYYQALNTGFRYPLAGASDFPYCRTLSDSMTFVMSSKSPTFESVLGGMIRGEAFASSGPLLFLSVDGQGPGGQIEMAGTGPKSVSVKVTCASSYLPINELELVVNGVAPAPGQPGNFDRRDPDLCPITGEATIKIDGSSWIAARCHGPQDARAHTNPVWIYVDGQAPFVSAGPDGSQAFRKNVNLSADRIGKLTTDSDVLGTLRNARKQLDDLIASQGHPVGPIPDYPRDLALGPGKTGALVMPPVSPRPAGLPPAIVMGTVVDEVDRPIEGAAVSARGKGAAARTDVRGGFTLRDVALDEPLFVRVEKGGYMTTNSSYLNGRCAGSCVRIVCLKSSYASALMGKGDPAAAWIAFNVFDERGVRKAGLGPAIRPCGGGTMDCRQSAPRFDFVGADGNLGAATTTASLANGIQAIARYSINFSRPSDSPEAPLPDGGNSAEPNVVIWDPSLAQDLVLPAFQGQVSYGAMMESATIK